MRLPQTIQVKLSSEEAGAISMTPVLSRQMPLRELVELMLDFTGKDLSRVHELLLRGTLVIGASRYRWAGLDADLEELTQMLSRLPSPQPERLFDPDHCVRLILHGPALRLEIGKQSFCERRFLRPRSFWDALMEIAGECGLAYVGYSYRERADRYRLEINASLAARLASSASLLRYTRLGEHFRNGSVERIEFLVERSDA